MRIDLQPHAIYRANAGGQLLARRISILVCAAVRASSGFARLGIVALLLVSWAAACAASPGDEVVVVYNSALPESKQIATYYAQRRHVPAQQVLGFELTTNENMTRAEFQDSLQRPLSVELEKRKLWHIAPEIVPPTTNQAGHVDWKVVRSRIRYAVLAYGVPLRILPDPNLKEPEAEKLQKELRRNEAAVDSELALLPTIEQKLPLVGPLRNPIYAATNLALFHPTNSVLMVARLDGPTAAIARGLIDKALAAEEHGLWGRAYFDVRNTTEPALKIGDDMIRSAAEICRRLGFETAVDESAGTFPAGFPMSQIAFYAGWYSENVCGPFALPNVEFMPGAFAYHLHSYSANSLRTTEKYWVGPLLAKGVTITMGTIDEPYLSGTPDISVFAARFLANGMSFGEAAYASQPVLSWQTTVVGDPLYRPFGRSLEQIAVDLEQRKSEYRDWCYLRLADLNQANGRPLAQVVSLLENLPLTTNSAVLTEKLGSLYAAQGKPSSSIHSFQQALALHPSLQQRVRLRLTLGEKLTALGRDADAYENYQALLTEYPDYPDKPAIYRLLLPLAQKLDKKADAERYESELKK